MSSSEFNYEPPQVEAASSENDASSPDRASRSHFRPASSSAGPSRKRTRSTRSASVKSVADNRNHLANHYSDAYRHLFNETVTSAAARFELDHSWHPRAAQLGTSIWSPEEKVAFFAALRRLGKGDLPGIAKTVGTKSIPEVQAFCLLIEDAIAKREKTGRARDDLTLIDIPAAFETGADCTARLELGGDALAWRQEGFEAKQEQDRYGHYWLITPAIAKHLDREAQSSRQTSRAPSSSTPGPAQPASRPQSSDFNSNWDGEDSLDGQEPQRIKQVKCFHCRLRRYACKRTGLHPQKCDRCFIRKTVCDEGDRDPQTSSSHQEPKKHIDPLDELQQLPEAELLNPAVMLELSSSVFMNGASKAPSWYPHWSTLTSPIASEPSIYRTALKDFHTLVLSLTRRLVQVCIMQATSRIRAQGWREKKGLALYVRRRDVVAALDVLNMQRDGRERWKGVARRCGLTVFDDETRKPRQLDWEEVEELLSLDERTSSEVGSTDVEENGESDFRSRAARSGTPLPHDTAVLSESDIEDVSDAEHRTDELNTDDDHSEAESLSSLVDSVEDSPQPEFEFLDVEAFDKEASRLEEQRLWDLLGVSPPPVDDMAEVQDDEESLGEDASNLLVVGSDDWRQWVRYRAEWERFESTPSAAAFRANQRFNRPKLSFTTRAPVEDNNSDNDSPSSDDEGYSGDRKSKRRKVAQTELPVRGARAYAALQDRMLASEGPEPEPESSDDENADVDPFPGQTQALDEPKDGSGMDDDDIRETIEYINPDI